MQIIDGAGVYGAASGGPVHWVEHLRVPDLSVGTYSIPAGGTDTQTPHTEDEIYVVTSGRAVIETPGGTAPVAPGSVIFVPALRGAPLHERHRGPGAAGDLRPGRGVPGHLSGAGRIPPGGQAQPSGASGWPARSAWPLAASQPRASCRACRVVYRGA